MARLLPHARPMSRAFVCVVFAVLAVACTGDPVPEAPAGSSDRTQAPPVVSATAYVYTDAAGIEARLTVQETGATLSIVNETTGPLPAPGVYVLDARDGTRVSWTVVAPVPVPAGETMEFDVHRPAVPDATNIGLAAMLFGGEDYGAFVPPQPGAGEGS
jgi:hypothetical protein